MSSTHSQGDLSVMSSNGSLGQQRAFGPCSGGPCFVIPIVGGLYLSWEMLLVLGSQPEVHSTQAVFDSWSSSCYFREKEEKLYPVPSLLKRPHIFDLVKLTA